MKIEGYYSCIRVNMPELFKDETFLKALIASSKGQHPKIATWHVGPDAGEYSDIFVTYEQGEGSDKASFPEELWKKLCEIAKDNHLDNCVFWITNMEE